MNEPQPEDVTVLLKAWHGGDGQALERLTPLVYSELRRIARRHMRKENAGNSMQATALVHEAYMRLVDAKLAEWQDRAHFFAISAQMMRRILVDAARAKDAEKRGGELNRVELNESIDGGPGAPSETLRLNDALDALAVFDPRKAKVVELRFFGGLSVEETAEVLKLSPQSVMRDWKLARAWLSREMATGKG
jgi:RNA polymerase sigma factor (TIGR02999 family)